MNLYLKRAFILFIILTAGMQLNAADEVPFFNSEGMDVQIQPTTEEADGISSSAEKEKNIVVDMGLQKQIFQRIGKDNSNPLLVKNLGAMKNYILTPGDIFRLSIKGGDLTSINNGSPVNYDIQLLEDYNIELPLIGSINCKGKNFPKLQKEVISQIKSTFSVFYVNFTFNQRAQFNIFVYGAVNNPGRVQATPLTTLSQAISAKGGFIKDGSYREIELRRNGKIERVDLSLFYSWADETQNPYLQPGDVIFIPTAKKLVQINGSIRNQGIYELLEEESIYDVISYAGGMGSDASTETFEIERNRGYTGERIYINHPIKESKSYIPENSDKIYIRSIMENGSILMVDGAVYGQRHARLTPEVASTRPVKVNLPYFEGATALSVLDTVGGPTAFAILEDAFIKRRGSLNREPFALKELWETRDPELDVKLHPGDIVVVPMQLLKIFVGGEVKSPGGFEYSNSLRALDYVMMAGGFNDSANMKKIYHLDAKGKPRQIELYSKLEPGTIVYIKKDHAAEASKVLQNITVYTSFLSSILSTVNAGVYTYRQIKAVAPLADSP